MKCFTACLLVAGLTLASSAPVMAKALCVSSSGGVHMIFPKVKALKPGRAVALTGVSTTGGPIDGTAYMNAAGTSATVHVVISGVPSPLCYDWTGDATLTGTGDFDIAPCDGASDGARTFTGVDCATLTLP